MSLFGKNIRKIRSLKSLSQQAFADIFDLKRGTLGAYEEGRSEPKTETIIKIANHFSISIDDILTKELTVNQLLKFRGELEDSLDITEKNNFNTIPCITPETQESYISNAAKTNYIDSLPRITLPTYNDKISRAFVVNSLEMSSNDNGLLPKDVVIGELVPKNEFDSIITSGIFLILTAKALVLKRVYPENNIFILKADNEGIEEVTVTHSEVKELWQITSVYYNRVLGSKNNHVLDKLAFLESEFNKLKSSL